MIDERIKQLSEQALNIVSNKRMLKDGQLERTWDPAAYDKAFAELIVRECIAISNDQYFAYEAVEALQKHFGVKE